MAASSSAAKGEGLRALAAFASATDPRQLPPAIVDKARACLLYGLAVGVASMRAEQPAQAIRIAAESGGSSTTRFFDDETCGPAAAALANATLLHARVQEDAHPAGHLGVVVIPAALAMAEARRTTGGELIAALISGYETALRIGRDHAADLSARGFRTTPAYGVFGAAAAAARLLRLDSDRTAHALSLAANLAAGLREFVDAGTGEFPFQAGFAARNGIDAARLAIAGASAAPSALDGAAGFFRAFGEAGRDYGARLAERLGVEFEMLAITYKPYPICQFHRGVVRGSAALSERAGRTPLAALTIRMHPFEADFFGVRFAGPFTSFSQAFMSAPFCAALGWARGTASYAALNDFAAADVLALVPRIEVVADDSRPRYGPRLTARLDDGASLDWEERERADAYTLTWDAARRMTEALCAEVEVPTPLAAGLIDAVAAIVDAPDVAPLIAAMRAACAAARGAASSP